MLLDVEAHLVVQLLLLLATLYLLRLVGIHLCGVLQYQTLYLSLRLGNLLLIVFVQLLALLHHEQVIIIPRRL